MPEPGTASGPAGAHPEAGGPASERWLGVVGVQPDEPPIRAPRGAALLAGAATVVGGPAELAAWRAWRGGNLALPDASTAEHTAVRVERPPTLPYGSRAPLPGAPDPAVLCFSRRHPEGRGGFAATVAAIGEAARPVCVLASGDPGFFGAVRALAGRFGQESLEIVPGVSSVALAFARLGLPWDDAVVVSAHGRLGGPDLETASAAACAGKSVALLTDPSATPASLAAALCTAGLGDRPAVVCEELGAPDETLLRGLLATLRTHEAAPGRRSVLVIPATVLDRESVRSWPPLPVAAAVPGQAPLPAGRSGRAGPSAPAVLPDHPAGARASDHPAGARASAHPAGARASEHPADPRAPDQPVCTRAPGGRSARGGFDLSVESLAHQRGQVTKPEVRAVVLAKLDPPAEGVCWDVGAGSGSVALACTSLRRGLRAFAIERDPAAAADIAANAAALGVEVAVVVGEAPAALRGLPAPDCAFVGGGGLGVLEAVWEQVPRGTRVVATLAALARAEQAGALLGNLVHVQVAAGRPLPDGGWRLAAENPVFIAWGARP